MSSFLSILFGENDKDSRRVPPLLALPAPPVSTPQERFQHELATTIAGLNTELAVLMGSGTIIMHETFWAVVRRHVVIPIVYRSIAKTLSGGETMAGIPQVPRTATIVTPFPIDIAIMVSALRELCKDKEQSRLGCICQSFVLLYEGPNGAAANEPDRLKIQSDNTLHLMPLPDGHLPTIIRVFSNMVIEPTLSMDARDQTAFTYWAPLPDPDKYTTVVRDSLSGRITPYTGNTLASLVSHDTLEQMVTIIAEHTLGLTHTDLDDLIRSIQWRMCMLQSQPSTPRTQTLDVDAKCLQLCMNEVEGWQAVAAVTLQKEQEIVRTILPTNGSTFRLEEHGLMSFADMRMQLRKRNRETDDDDDGEKQVPGRNKTLAPPRYQVVDTQSGGPVLKLASMDDNHRETSPHQQGHAPKRQRGLGYESADSNVTRDQSPAAVFAPVYRHPVRPTDDGAAAAANPPTNTSPHTPPITSLPLTDYGPMA